MVALRLARVAAVSVALAACGGAETRTIRVERVAPAADPDCGAPADARTILVTALGEFGATEGTVRSLDATDEGEVDIAGFPSETAVLEVEVLGLGGATPRAIGRTALFDVSALEDGAAVQVFMAPPQGVCPTGPPAVARDRPLAARLGPGVIVAGGRDEDGDPVDEVEYYDPATGALVPLGDVLYGGDADTGLAGASMTAMPDGRVVVAGGGATAFQIVDPVTRVAEPARFLRQGRAHHAAVALDADHVLLAGGCARLEGDGCAADSALATSSILSLDDGELDDGPALQRVRIGGRAIVEADGRVLLVGGVDEDGGLVTVAERIDPAGGDGVLVDGAAGGEAAALAAGGALVGFAPDGAAPASVAAVVPPGGTSARPVGGGAVARAGATLTALEGGDVLIAGGAGEPPLAVYAPLRGEIDPLDAPLPELAGHAAVRLDDGSVFLVGGHDEVGDALAGAWIYRPDLVGPFTAGRSVTFATDESAAALVPRDPARGSRVAADDDTPAHYEIEATAGGEVAREWAILAGPRFVDVSVEARVAADGGGAGILFWWESAARHAMVALEPGEAARVVVVEDGDAVSVCSGERVDGGDLESPESGAAHDLVVSVDEGEIAVALDGREVLHCSVDPLPGGQVGVAPLGDGAVLRLDLLSAAR
ncbi:MAG TPA: hypothetical protein VMZ28_09980 [Kofleriaceae bacterium]|nr:hypothetical protein [Kofleriaceae bacterium]